MIPTDHGKEIDALVDSVRSLVSRDAPAAPRKLPGLSRLVLTADMLVGDMPVPRPMAAPPALMDPETLRATVRQVLREELAGDLGERMTRDLRKLVRREINRVLAARDMG